MKSLKSLFVFTRKQRKGIFLLVIFIGIIQVLYYVLDFSNTEIFDLDSLEIVQLQQKYDSLHLQQNADNLSNNYSFNPNFIDDHRGYMLGMSPVEIDRLLQYRQAGNWVNSVTEFQQITGVSDSLLAVISPRFRFPEWVTQRHSSPDLSKKRVNNKTPIVRRDLNEATAEELQEVYGVGEVLAARIVKYRQRLNGFLTDEQLYDVYGLSPQTVENIKQKFTVITRPTVQKINLNTATASDLATLPFISFQLAKEIVDYRLLHQGFTNLEQLKEVNDFPVEKFERFTLYLALD